MSLDTAAPQLAERGWSEAVRLALRLVLALGLLAIVIQAAIVVRARPQDLITGAYGMADIIRRAMPPDSAKSTRCGGRHSRPSTSAFSAPSAASFWLCRWRFSPPPM